MSISTFLSYNLIFVSLKILLSIFYRQLEISPQAQMLMEQKALDIQGYVFEAKEEQLRPKRFLILFFIYKVRLGQQYK